jgi:UDP-N-acetylglucosamine 4,6-dehydratase/5-epimerase
MSEFKNQVLLITGGTGSFGNAVLDQLIREDFAEVRVFSRDEKKQHDMRMRLANPKIKFYIGDVRDYRSVFDAMYGADYVFHAAALKQVPSCEFYPMEAVKTNVIGTENVLNAAIACKTKRIVVLSTDKAVGPVNAMGLSKALLEKVMVAKSRLVGDQSETVMSGTRYGNVIASRGSVIPMFIRQIRAGEPLTVTDPNMTRFLMPLSAAVDLVMFAFKNAKSGDIFVQQAPSCTIGDLAQAVKELMNANNPVKIIGTRHGEKLHETLLSREEKSRAQAIGNFFRVSPDDRDLNYEKYFDIGDSRIDSLEDYSSNNAMILSVSEIKELLMTAPELAEQFSG